MTYRSLIETDIYKIIRHHRTDVSREMGFVLRSFVSYWRKRNSKEQEEMPFGFFYMARGLQEYLTYRTGKLASLDGLIKSGAEIFRILRRKRGIELVELYKYLGELREGKRRERARLLPPAVPRGWLNRE